jgi:hypothetical protein
MHGPSPSAARRLASVARVLAAQLELELNAASFAPEKTM